MPIKKARRGTNPRRAFVIPSYQGSNEYLTHTRTLAQGVAQFPQKSLEKII
jgi:hypothetical protein